MSNLKSSLEQLAERGDPIGSDRLRERVAMELAGTAESDRARSVPGWTIAAAVAAASLIVIGVASLLLGGSDGAVEPLPPAASTTTVGETPAQLLPADSTTSTPTTATGTETPVTAAGWNPILAETSAKEAPPAAVCPSGADPGTPGPVDQARPGEGPWSNQSAVFDTRTGRVVFVDNVGRTWTFDVCTNTWQDMDPETPWHTTGSRFIGELVYDMDSDRTIAFNSTAVSIYDASTNSWSRGSAPPNVDSPPASYGLGAVYDPVTGLVLVLRHDGMLMAYDVDTDTWTDVGTIMGSTSIALDGESPEEWPPFMIGYVAELDRLTFLPFQSHPPVHDLGGLLDPRSGKFTASIDHPEGGVWGGFGMFSYATGGDTAYAETGTNSVCRLNAETHEWDCVSAAQEEGSSAMVFDSINDRVVIIKNFCCNWPGSTVTDPVLAIEFASGTQVELLPAANEWIAD